MKINPSIMASAIGRYDKAIRKDKATPSAETAKDKVELSENAKIYSNLVKAALSGEEISMDKVHGVMNRIAAGTYEIDANAIVDSICRGK